VDQGPNLSLLRLLLPILAVLTLASCTAVQDPYAPIPDLTTFEQRASAYVEDGEPIMGFADHRQAAENFLEGFFAPWRRAEPVHDAEEAAWGLRLADSKRFFGENTLPKPDGWARRMRELSDLETFPNMRLAAVAAVNTSMRVLPTDRPAFYDFAKAGEGFPFDMLQNSAVWAGTPLFISHESEDGAWVLAESRYAFGWIPARDVALVSGPLADALSKGPFVTPVADRVPLHDWSGSYLFDLRIGQMLPAVARTAEGFALLAPVRDADGSARFVEAEVSLEHVRAWPLFPTTRALAGLADEIMGQPYGWGGLYGNRDCSSTLMDMFAAVGVPLPRNSRVQAKSGKVVDLSGLDPDAKRRLVLEQGIPFATLLTRPGHIMLYIGHKEGEPLVLHTAWGLKTEDFRGREGRKVIGGTVITSLAPGSGVRGLASPQGKLLNQLTTMTFIGAQTVSKTGEP
jgi:hypothetical protein